jgi:hypothetical protein
MECVVHFIPSTSPSARHMVGVQPCVDLISVKPLLQQTLFQSVETSSKQDRWASASKSSTSNLHDAGAGWSKVGKDGMAISMLFLSNITSHAFILCGCWTSLSEELKLWRSLALRGIYTPASLAPCKKKKISEYKTWSVYNSRQNVLSVGNYFILCNLKTSM